LELEKVSFYDIDLLIFRLFLVGSFMHVVGVYLASMVDRFLYFNMLFGIISPLGIGLAVSVQFENKLLQYMSPMKLVWLHFPKSK
jgi:hypothetical protein